MLAGAVDTAAPPAPDAELASDMSPPPALLQLADRLALSPLECKLLLLCAAVELDPSIAALCSRVQGNPSFTYATFALARSLFDGLSWDALSPERPLRRWRLIETDPLRAAPLSAAPLRADERIVNFLNGVTYLDDRLAPLLTPLALPEVIVDAQSGTGSFVLAPSHAALVAEIVEHCLATESAGGSPAVHLFGSDVASRRAVAAVSAQRLGFEIVYLLDGAVLPPTLGELDALARLWQRESLLLPVALYVETDAADAARPMAALLLARLGGTVFIGSRHLWSAAGTPMTFEVCKPTGAEQCAAWEAASTEIGSDTAGRLADQFDLDLAAIRILARREVAVAAAAAPLEDRLWAGARAVTRPGLDSLARRIVSNAGWNDLVLPPAETALLRRIADQVGQRGRVYRDWGFAERMSRGRAISALFAGSSGTGKTLAAEVLANDLRLDLFRIDLSAVVSKYIGETEANLRRLFDAAEGGGAILFFDEADALFGKRTEVKDSHDRYANIEINYLLQRMESYGGLAVLATNMKSALDQAFLRRLRFVIDFPFPGPVEREAIWRQAFPSDTPTEDLDFARLGRLNVSGGHIAVIAVNAAFSAARGGPKAPVTMPMVLDAARIEFRKLDRPVREADFR